MPNFFGTYGPQCSCSSIKCAFSLARIRIKLAREMRLEAKANGWVLDMRNGKFLLIAPAIPSTWDVAVEVAWGSE